MIKKGVCKHYNGVFGPGLKEDKKCEKGIDYRAMVGGPDHGWVARTPCFKNHSTEIGCDLYCEPTIDEIEQDKKELDKLMGKMEAVFHIIPKLKEQNKHGGNGVMECPICRKELHWTVSPANHHVRLVRSGGACINIME